LLSAAAAPPFRSSDAPAQPPQPAGNTAHACVHTQTGSATITIRHCCKGLEPTISRQAGGPAFLRLPIVSIVTLQPLDHTLAVPTQAHCARLAFGRAIAKLTAKMPPTMQLLLCQI
jgi:hypothetical protein